MSAAQASATMPPDRVNLVDEDDGGRFGFGALEQIADAAGAHADEHLDEFRAGNAEEGHARFPGDSARHQRLAGAGRSYHQHALGHARAQADELLRLLEKFDNLFEVFLRFFGAGDVFEGHLGPFHIAGDARLAAPEAHRLVLPGAHRAHHPPQEPDDDQNRHDAEQNLEDDAGRVIGGMRHKVHIRQRRTRDIKRAHQLVEV